jgi:hypothetical protein
MFSGQIYSGEMSSGQISSGKMSSGEMYVRANVSPGKCISGEMYLRAIVFRAIVFAGKCHPAKCLPAIVIRPNVFRKNIFRANVSPGECSPGKFIRANVFRANVIQPFKIQLCALLRCNRQKHGNFYIYVQSSYLMYYQKFAQNCYSLFSYILNDNNNKKLKFFCKCLVFQCIYIYSDILWLAITRRTENLWLLFTFSSIMLMLIQMTKWRLSVAYIVIYSVLEKTKLKRFTQRIKCRIKCEKNPFFASQC